VHLQTSLVQSFVLVFQNFEEVVQIIALKRFGGAPHYNQLAPLEMREDGRRDRLSDRWGPLVRTDKKIG
jgi:hypothetical protein